MNITVKAATALREYLPAEAIRGKVQLEVAEGSTPLDIVRLLGIPDDQRLMIIVDGAMVTRAEFATLTLSEAQTLSLNPPIQAG